MGKNLYVGGLPYSVTDEQLQELFEAHGAVESARVITDRYTGQSRGFGFVEMDAEEGAQQAIEALNGSNMGGRTITVNEARPRENRPSRGPGGGGDGGNRGRW